MTDVLVTFASKMGATEEIAEAIGKRLSERGCPADVCPVGTVDGVDGYRAVVLGSAVYAGRWRKEAAQFFTRHLHALAEREVWLFESGWVGRRPTPLTPTRGGQWRARRIGAPAPVVFGGRLDPDLATGFLDRALAHRIPGDARDWAEIAAWADRIADALIAEIH